MDLDQTGRAIQALEFDSAFTIGTDGTVAPAPGWYAPEVTIADGTTTVHDSDRDRWSVVIMAEPAEYVNGATARMLTDGHDAGTVFCLVVVMADDDDDDPDDDDRTAGWAIVAARESFPGYAQVCGACACLITNGDASGDAFADDPEWRGKALDTFLTARCPSDAWTDIIVTPVGVDGSPDDWPEDAGQTRTDAPCDVCGESDASYSPTLHDALTRTRHA